MLRMSRFFLRQLIIALAAAVPLLAILAWTLSRGVDDTREAAYREIQTKSRGAARSVDDALDGAERLLVFVARHQDVRDLDPARCSAFLLGLEGVDPGNAVITVLDLDGNVVCTSVKSTTRPRSAGGSEWFERARTSDGFFLGKPAIGRITGKPVAPLSTAVRDAAGTTIAVAVVSLDLLRLQEEMVGDWTAREGLLALLNEDSQFLVRSPDTVAWLGRPAPAAANSTNRDTPDGIVVAPGVDGVERVFAATPLSRYQLRVVASIPADVVFGRARAQIRSGIVVSLVALLLASLFAFYGATFLSRPLDSLARSARAFASGSEDARADESLPIEFKDLAIEMNSMHDARRRSESSARDSERRVLRLARFYEATTRANQAIVRLRGEDELFDTICQVCVDTGHASMAWIGLVRGSRLVPVAWAGPARAYTEAFELDLGPLAEPAGGAFGASVLGGNTRVVSDYVNDPRTLPFRDNAARYDVRSSAIIPFSRGGSVVGTLNLYANEIGFFDDELLRLLVEMGTDISFALESLAKSAEHARTQRQLAGIVESAMDAVITIDASERVLVFNSAAARMFRTTAAQGLAGSMDRFIPERFRAAHVAYVARFAAAGRSGPDGAEPRELIGLRGDGTEFPMEASISRIEEGGEVQLTVLIRDVTGKRDAQEARLAASVADASNRAKSTFMARMSHELRTPLNAVLGFSQLLQSSAKDKLDERERRQLDMVFLAGAQLRALVDDVLDVSTIDSGRLSLSLHDFELTALLDGVVRMSDAAARDAGVAVRTTYAAVEPLVLRTDPVRLRQVALNLVSNAIKYNRRGGTVTIGVEALDGIVRITIADNGLGMSQAQLAGLFQPFNRLGREHSAIAGTGIGMALVRQLVELMGGSVSVTSEEGTGTTARVDLARPTAESLVLSVDALLPVRDVPSDARPAAPIGLVLYIEDNSVNVMLIQHVVERWPDVLLVIAIDGASGIAQARALQPDIVLLDMQLPDMTGLEVLETLSDDASTRALRVVALSANTDADDVAAARAAGAIDYWTKPIVVETFCRKMSDLLAASTVQAARSVT